MTSKGCDDVTHPTVRDDIWRRLGDRAAAITQINSPARCICHCLSLTDLNTKDTLIVNL